MLHSPAARFRLWRPAGRSVITFLSFAFIGKAVESVKPATISLMPRIGGLLLATIGAQMLLGGSKSFMGL